jgi:hypothetical protein
MCYHGRTLRKPKPPPDDPEQSKRFIEAARALGTDETGEAFERAFEKVARPKRPLSGPKTNRSRPSAKRSSS